MQILTDERLNKMSTQRLFNILKNARVYANPNYWEKQYWILYDEVTKEWMGTDDEYRVRVTNPSNRYIQYKERIKKILGTRPDQFSHRK